MRCFVVSARPTKLSPQEQGNTITLRGWFRSRGSTPQAEYCTGNGETLGIPHPALRATLSRRERDCPADRPSPSGRRWPEGPDEGSSFLLLCPVFGPSLR